MHKGASVAKDDGQATSEIAFHDPGLFEWRVNLGEIEICNATALRLAASAS